jgi:CheY-like chemotaxis protein
MKILVVDDSATIRNILKGILEESGHEVFEVNSGENAVEFFSDQKKPDLILMDVEMSGMSGYDTAKKIRAIESDSEEKNVDDWIPIVFLSSHSDDESLSAGIEAGGDDYLFKPFSKTVLNSKLKAMERIYSMKQAIVSQKKMVESMNKELMEEQIVAKNIYDNIVNAGNIQQQDFVKTYVSSKSIFNGDIALTALSPSQNYYIIMGDFTGHGLSAALGVMPTVELFLKLTVKGYTLEQLLIELNAKLHSILPSNIFCAAAVLEVDLQKSQVAVWNGWSPEVICASEDGKIKKTFPSTHMPLGALSAEKFNSQLEFIDLNKGDKVYIYSDGFSESKNVKGEMFEVDGMKAAIEKTGTEKKMSIFDGIIHEINLFREGSSQEDDLTLIEIDIQPTN